MIIPVFHVNQRNEKAEHPFAYSEIEKPAVVIVLICFAPVHKPIC